MNHVHCSHGAERVTIREAPAAPRTGLALVPTLPADLPFPYIITYVCPSVCRCPPFGGAMARLGLNAESGRPTRLARATIPSLLRLHRRGDLHIPRLSTVERGPAHRACDEPPSRRVHPAVGWDRTSLHRAVAERQAVAAGQSGTLRLQRPMVSGSLQTRSSEPPITCAMWWLVNECTSWSTPTRRSSQLALLMIIVF